VGEIDIWIHPETDGRQTLACRNARVAAVLAGLVDVGQKGQHADFGLRARALEGVGRHHLRDLHGAQRLLRESLSGEEDDKEEEGVMDGWMDG
jgi:hypothetical protein